MKIVVYGLPHCGQCKAFCSYLNLKDIEYSYIEDVDKVTELGQKYEILSAPVVDIDNKFYNSKDATSIIEG